MSRYNVLKIFDYSIFTSNLNQIRLGPKCLINTLNQYSYIIAEKDQVFKTALIESDILLPDGIGIVAAVRLLKGQRIKKIAGADVHNYLLKELEKVGGRCFYLGSSQKTLAEIESRLGVEYPNIKVSSYSPPFKSNFSNADNEKMVEQVNSFKPDVLFVGMTAPKQEKWTFEHKNELDAKIICSIGAVFDFYAGTVERPGQFWIDAGLEWLVRLINEPNHMWKRYLFYGPVFVFIVLKEKVKASVNRR
jgi:N-acetylglucosaminyldiphosphoundecaprenol N-acetyl-beta-D-mannosaminyltransferase